MVRRMAMVLVALVAAACTTPAPKPLQYPTVSSLPAPTTQAPIPRFGVSGTSLTLDGEPWWPIGINAYQLGTDWSINAGCGAQVDLDDYFGSLPPHSLTRVNVYSTLAANKHTGLLDFSALDAVFRAAERHGQLLIAVLTADEGGCEDERVKDNDWYGGGWRTEVAPGMPMAFADWLHTAVTRWRDSPALAGWTASGEPEPSHCIDHHCHWTTRVCPPESAAVLRAFLDDTGALIRDLDPDAVIFSGHAGGGQCGSKDTRFEMVNASPGVDVLEYHYYEENDYLPGNRYDGLQRRIEQSRKLNKPLLVAEIGMEAGSCTSLAERRQILGDAVDLMHAHGAAGVMFWAFVPDPRLSECTLDIGPNDPLFAMIGRAPPA